MKANKIVLILVVLVLLLVSMSLLFYSGLIPTSISPIAYERLNYSHLKTLSEIVNLATNDTTPEKWNLAVFQKYADNIEDFIYELPDKQRYSIYPRPISNLQIILSGNKKDELGMIWAITEKGDLIKIPADLMKSKVK